MSVCSPPGTPPYGMWSDEILRGAMRDGSLERIFRKWSVWNDDQPALYASLIARKSVPAVSIAGSASRIGVATLSRQEATLRYIPSLVKAAGVTLILSCLAMAIAVVPWCPRLRAAASTGRGPFGSRSPVTWS